MERCQVRKRNGRWEVWSFTGRSWEKCCDFHAYEYAMIMATGQEPWP